MIGKGYKFEVDVSVRHKGQRYALQRPHGAVIDADGVIAAVVLEYQIVIRHFADDLEIGAAAVLPFRLGIEDLGDLRVCVGRVEARKREEEKGQDSVHSRTQRFIVREILSKLVKSTVFIKVRLPVLSL
jgi:hypothetical protein